MADMARRCGLSTKTIYECYSSKEDLILDMVQQAIDELTEREQSIVNDPKLGTMDKLRALLVLLPRDFQFLISSVCTNCNVITRMCGTLWIPFDGTVGRCDPNACGGSGGRTAGEVQYGAVHSAVYRGLYRLMEQASTGAAQMTLRQALDEMVDIMLNGIRKR